jgi:hypothetical protein
MPPIPKRDNDPFLFGKFNLKDGSLVVSADGGIKNVIAYLYLGRGAARVPIHQSYIDRVRETIAMDNIECRFEPHISLLWTPQTLAVGNGDDVGHNVNFTAIKNLPINILIPSKSTTPVRFPLEERVPMSVACNIHPWMKGYVVVRDNPYFAVSDKNGNLSIKNLPEGEWTIQFWQEKAGYVRSGKREGVPINWKSGRTTIMIDNGQTTNLGTIDLAPELFEE